FPRRFELLRSSRDQRLIDVLQVGLCENRVDLFSHGSIPSFRPLGLSHFLYGASQFHDSLVILRDFLVFGPRSALSFSQFSNLSSEARVMRHQLLHLGIAPLVVDASRLGFDCSLVNLRGWRLGRSRLFGLGLDLDRRSCRFNRRRSLYGSRGLLLTDGVGIL